MKFIFVISFVIQIFSLVVNSLTESDVVKIQNDIKSMFKLGPAYGDPCNGKLQPCPKGDSIGALVRLTFHDAAGEWGPNGCIDFNNTNDSNGLQTVVQQLQELYTSKGYQSLLSIADLYVLAGNTAIEYASTQDGKQNATGLDPVPEPLILPFRYGRIDAPICNDSGYLPPISFDWSQMKSLFYGRFNMTVRETVAIMGAHSVGRCQYVNLGVDGGWTPTQSSFSNKYYQVFGNIKWDNNNDSDVWVDNFPSGPEGILLKPDVELLFQTNNTKAGFCSSFHTFSPTPSCPYQAETYQIFLDYTDNINYFFTNFSTAWQKLTEYTYKEGQLQSVLAL